MVDDRARENLDGCLLRRLTPARVALARAGGSLSTAETLRLALDCAAARDAVHASFDPDRLQRDLEPLGLPIVTLRTEAPDHAAYLLRPDLGRRLDAESRQRLQPLAGASDVAIIVADGLSAMAAHQQALPTLSALLPMLRDSGLKIGPLSLVRFGRVAVEDEIGGILGARLALILLGERPGLGSPHSLGAYLVHGPSPGRTDADRNCVSNIRPGGLPPTVAAQTLHYLIAKALVRNISGVNLKDDRHGLSVSQPPRKLRGWSGAE